MCTYMCPYICIHIINEYLKQLQSCPSRDVTSGYPNDEQYSGEIVDGALHGMPIISISNDSHIHTLACVDHNDYGTDVWDMLLTYDWRMRHVTDVWLTYETCYQCLPGWCDVQRRDSRWCAARAWCFGHALRALRRWAPCVLQWCVLKSVLQCMLQCVSQCEWGCFGHALRAMRRWAPCVLQCALRCVLQYVLQRVSHVALVTHYRLHVDEFVPNILIYIHVYLYLYVNMYLYIYVHMHVYMRIWIHMYAWIFVIRRWVRAV